MTAPPDDAQLSRVLRRVHPEVRALVDQLVHSDEAVRRWLKKSKAIRSMVRLPGDASARRYYRIRSENKTFILMKRDPFQKEKEGLPFIVVQRHLKKSGIHVPEIYDFDAKQGYLLLEDLGDHTLLHQLQGVTDLEVERHIYQKVIDDLVRLHYFGTKSGEKLKKKIVPFRLAFDEEKLNWEVNFTIENFYELHLNRKFKPRDKKNIQSQFTSICKEIAAEPRVLTHRDFHSRNIMVIPTGSKKKSFSHILSGRFVMIDFQDARMGPKQYDLASLLKDSYYQLDEVQVRRLVDYYITSWEAVSGEKVNREDFHRLFDLVSLQRNFKAIGSFASFLSKRGNATYLKYIGNTFENMRRTLLRHPKYSTLREILFHYYYF